MKRVVSFFLCMCLIVAILAVPVSANPNSGMILVSETVEYIDRDTYFVERIYIPEICSYSNGKTATKTAEGFYKGATVFFISLTGHFTYDGTSAVATSASVAVSASVSGASLNSKNAYTSGASAIGSCSVSYVGAMLNKTVTLTCDANGNLS